MKIDNLRNQIDLLDNQLLKLLVKRFKLSQKIGSFKKLHGLPVTDKKRENEVLSTKIDQAKKRKLSEVFIKKVFSLIIKESRARQK